MPGAGQSQLVPHNLELRGQMPSAQSRSRPLPLQQFRSAPINLAGPSKAPPLAQLPTVRGPANPGHVVAAFSSTHLLANVVIGQVDDRAKPLQHVKDHLSVTALCPRGEEGSPSSGGGVGSGPPRALKGRALVGGSYLEECHFAHDVVVHVDGKVQPHLVWKLNHQL